MVNNLTSYDVIIVGAGASGLMAAGVCGRRGLKALVMDKNRAAGRKLRITGKGRCNLTNDTDAAGVIAAAVRGGKFLYTALSRMSPSGLMAFFEERGVPLKVERGSRVFPASDDANDIADILVKETEGSGAEFLFETRADLITADSGGGFTVKTKRGEFKSGSLLLA